MNLLFRNSVKTNFSETDTEIKKEKTGVSGNDVYNTGCPEFCV